MIQIRNNSALTTSVSIPAGGATVPFDTTVINSNNSLSLLNNSVVISTAGLYESECTVQVTNAGSSEATVAISVYSDGIQNAGAIVTQSIAAGDTGSLYISWISNVVSAPTGKATLSWNVSGAEVTMSNAFASVKRIL